MDPENLMEKSIILGEIESQSLVNFQWIFKILLEEYLGFKSGSKLGTISIGSN